MKERLPGTVLVLGMHRSGTSALAGALARGGFCAGDETTLYGADSNNEKGFYEQREVVTINESILVNSFLHQFPELKEYRCAVSTEDMDGLGWLFGAWLDTSRIVVKDIQLERIRKFLSRLYGENAGYSRFVIKDPRLSLTLPFWSQHLIRPALLIMVRNPVAVAGSLWRRDQLFDELSYLLWLRYTSMALSYAGSYPAYVIDYDSFVESPEQTVRNVYSWLGHHGFNLKDELLDQATQFVSPELRHHTQSTDIILPEYIREPYLHIKSSAPAPLPVEGLESVWEKTPCPWQSALYLLARKSMTSMTRRLTVAELAHKRLVRHPVAGLIISVLKNIKQDETFGFLDYHLLSENPATTREPAKNNKSGTADTDVRSMGGDVNVTIEKRYYDGDRNEMLPFVPVTARRILEIGCANGRFSFLVKQRQDCESWGIELNPEAASVAASRLDKVITGDVAGAVNELPVDYFDCIVCNDILEHLPEPEKMLSTLKKYLVKGGVIVASIPNVRYLPVLYDLLFRKEWRYRDFGVLDKTHLRFFTRKSIARLFMSAGYGLSRIQGLRIQTPFVYSVIFFFVSVVTLGYYRDTRFIQYACVARKPDVRDG